MHLSSRSRALRRLPAYLRRTSAKDANPGLSRASASAQTIGSISRCGGRSLMHRADPKHNSSAPTGTRLPAGARRRFEYCPAIMISKRIKSVKLPTYCVMALLTRSVAGSCAKFYPVGGLVTSPAKLKPKGAQACRYVPTAAAITCLLTTLSWTHICEAWATVCTRSSARRTLLLQAVKQRCFSVEVTCDGTAQNIFYQGD